MGGIRNRVVTCDICNLVGVEKVCDSILLSAAKLTLRLGLTDFKISSNSIDFMSQMDIELMSLLVSTGE